MATDTGFGMVRLFDDFLGDVIADQWSNAVAGGGAAAAVSAAVGGKITLATHGNSGDLSVVTYGLNWEASSGGPLIMEARISNVSAITSRAIFVGFTYVLATGTCEMPIESAGATSTASDAVGFSYDTGAANDTWYLTGVKDNIDATVVNTGEAPAAAGTWTTLRVVVDITGNATFFIDGVYKGAVADAITATDDVTPVIALETRSENIVSLDCDYIHVSGGRA